MSTNSPRPFTTVAGNGLRPYYTPGLNTNNNYTTVPDAQSVAMPYASNNYDDLIDSKAAARELINFIVLKYMTSAVSSPFEVSRTLLQVQYMPRGNKELSSFSQTNNSDKGYSDNEEEQFSSDSGEEEEEDIEEEFFENARYRRRKHHSDDDNLNSSTLNVDDPVFKQKMDVDASGYVVQTSVYDESTRPPHQMKPIEGGVWSGIKKLMKQPHEGWRSLFKGQYTNWLYDISHLFLQPTLEGSLNDLFGLYDDTIPLVHLDNVGPNLATLVASNLLVGVFLSPLELIRTRLQVQSSSPLQRKYKGPFHALRTIIQEEGGVKGLYLNHNLLPTILYHTLTPLIQNSIPLIIDRVFHISVNESPFLYSFAELCLNTLDVIIMLPLDTIRKRLQCQIRTRTPGKKQYETVVALRPVPYAGIIDALCSIMKEEGGRPNCEKKKAKNSNKKLLRGRGVLTDWSFRGLYHGFQMQCTSNAVVFLLHAINGIEDDYEDF